MKHLLIILSILLLSSPLFGQETGVLYQYETSGGTKWRTFGDGKVQPKYMGEIKNGKIHGLGVLTYPYDGKSILGEWKDGMRSGHGTFTSHEGWKYVGEFKDDKRWNGIYYDQNGNSIGKYVNGKEIKQ